MTIKVTPSGEPTINEHLAITVLIKGCLLRMATSRMFVLTGAQIDGVDIGDWEIAITQSNIPKPPREGDPEPEPTPNQPDIVLL